MKMRENILERVQMVEDRKGIRYAKKTGYAYTRLRVLYALAGLYTLAMHAMLFLGKWISGELKLYRLEFTIIGVCTALMIAGYIGIRLRGKRAARLPLDLMCGTVSIICEAVLIVLFARMLEKDVITSNIFRYHTSYYYRHFIPLVLMILVILIMTIIALREKHIRKKEYKQVLENLYAAYREKQGKNFSEEEWLAFLETYDPAKHKEIFEEKDNQKTKFTSEKTEENKRKNEK